MGLTEPERADLNRRLAELNRRLDDSEAMLLSIRTSLHLMRADLIRLQRESDMTNQKGDDN